MSPPNTVSESEIRNRLRAEIIRSRLTLTEWCQQNGFDKSAMSRILNGHRGPNLEVLRLLGLRQETIYYVEIKDNV
jgi:hypothetical protein